MRSSAAPSVASESPGAEPVASTVAPAPGLEAPVEQRLIVVADFLPESRNFGEMPVRTGEEIFVSGESLDGWIFGVKRSGGGDEGWLPASALLNEELERERE